MDLDTYIELLKRTKDEIPDIVNKFVEEQSSYIVGQVKNRFYQYGVDGDGKLIGGGKYSERTIKRKEKNARYSRTSHVTLADTGQWWDSLFASYHKGKIELNSKMPDLTEKLIEGEGKWFAGYGSAIMDFTEDELIMYEDQILKDLYEHLEGIFNTGEKVDI